jgi:fatty-acyl-CoA synthase
VLEAGAQLDVPELKRHLLDIVANWWVPEEFVAIDEVPKTSVGKFDKKVLRARLQEGTLRPADTLSA